MSSQKIPLYTIGFTQKSAQEFFGLLRDHQVKALIDTRLKPSSQLSGFAKKQDLPFFLRSLAACDYSHALDMAPTDDLLDQYRKDKNWLKYEAAYLDLIQSRNLLAKVDIGRWLKEPVCLLCSEHLPHRCHRRLVAEYIAQNYPEFEVVHLK